MARFSRKMTFLSLVLVFTLVSEAAPIEEGIGLRFDAGKIALRNLLPERVEAQREKIYRVQDEHFRLKIARTDAVAKAAALKLIDERLSLLNSMFETQVSPYPDQISKSIKCEDPPKAVERKMPDGFMKSMSLWANDRFAFGSCDPSQRKNAAAVALVHCEVKQRFFDIEAFASTAGGLDAAKAEIERFLASIECGR